jgi:hypothetical protein
MTSLKITMANSQTAKSMAICDSTRTLRNQRLSSRRPHASQNLAPARFSAPHFVQRMLSPKSLWLRSELDEECFGVFQVGGVEALGEPMVDVGEHRARFVATTLIIK